MRKIMVLILQFIFCMSLSSCGNDYTEYYRERLNDYETIAHYALENYATDDGSVVTVQLQDITDVDLEKSILVAEEKFTYIWIENNSVIFWNDETKTLGLVCSENMKNTIKDIEEWYDDVDKEKIHNNYYLIGQLNSI